MIFLIVLLIIVVLVVVKVIGVYNNLIQRRNRVNNAWAQIDVQLQKRFDLIGFKEGTLLTIKEEARENIRVQF